MNKKKEVFCLYNKNSIESGLDSNSSSGISAGLHIAIQVDNQVHSFSSDGLRVKDTEVGFFCITFAVSLNFVFFSGLW